MAELGCHAGWGCLADADDVLGMTWRVLCEEEAQREGGGGITQQIFYCEGGETEGKPCAPSHPHPLVGMTNKGIN